MMALASGTGGVMEGVYDMRAYYLRYKMLGLMICKIYKIWWGVMI